jgi:hypothetical protein
MSAHAKLLKPGDRVWAKYRGTGLVVYPTDEDLAKPRFDDDVCVNFNLWDGRPFTIWLGQSVLELQEEE